MKTTKNLQDRLSAHQYSAHRLSQKLRAWAVLLEKQSECEGFTELAGLGMSLREYSRKLRRIAHGLDMIQVETSRNGGCK